MITPIYNLDGLCYKVEEPELSYENIYVSETEAKIRQINLDKTKLFINTYKKYGDFYYKFNDFMSDGTTVINESFLTFSHGDLKGISRVVTSHYPNSSKIKQETETIDITKFLSGRYLDALRKLKCSMAELRKVKTSNELSKATKFILENKLIELDCDYNFLIAYMKEFYLDEYNHYVEKHLGN